MGRFAFSLTRAAAFTNSSCTPGLLDSGKEPVAAMIRNAGATFGLTALACVLVMYAGAVRADEAVTIAITIKDHTFDPAEVHAPAGKPISISVKNLDAIAAEFESDALHVEKVVPPGREVVVRVRPLEPGRYNFLDDFHRATQGVLVVP
jgi:heme/copper-type cytochrome/quinol oxidase subunit 2